jgi:hypothetical protein
VSHYIVFDEQAQWEWKKDSDRKHQASDTFIVEYLVTREPPVAQGIVVELERHESIGDIVSHVQRGGDHDQSAGDRASSRNPLVASSALDADHDEQVPVSTKRLSDIMAEEPQLHVVSSDEPTSLAEAQVDHYWKNIMEEEMSLIEANETWTLCDLPKGCQVIGLKWVFKVKRNEQGDVVKHKESLVVKCYA